ncbi:bifunctional 2-polyprenyl-6-hydroxyphenol methylase/3-demethylubiquinol 3-O-methyltransferase UbiG [Sporosarcina sp. Te-1]|uniref:class I SAM-dependent methyltransferase n=1 Tax=Sporosarcina sp. Te-1 TaxID=2818390 RepID=UPI001A9D8D83|nr:class I SAM-dependent methyltransferase [Sporosarcina sp. Te-1]QTD41861.1 class I SAM-dependent methyltransferase [Sporosarcina sp. Te-1]
MSFSYYGELCTTVYNLTKPIGHSFGGEIAYYKERLKGCKGRVLEPMAGSGRFMIPLLEEGVRVEGVDVSPEMLASCHKQCEERGLAPTLYEADITELSLPHRYEAITIPAGSFQLIEERHDAMNVLKRLYEHLEPGGRLLLDLFLPDAVFDNIGTFVGTTAYSLPNGDTITMEEKLVEADLFRQRKVSYLKYEKWREGKLIQTELQRFAICWYGIEEFKLILQSIGFTDVVVSADFQYGTPPSSQDQTFTFEAVK